MWLLIAFGFSSQQSGRMHGWITDRYEGIIVNSEEMTLLSAGFEAGFPSDWTVIDNDGDGNQWGVYNSSASFDFTHYGAVGAGIFTNYASNNDYLITPLIEIPSNTASSIFSFWAKSHSSSYPEDFVARISTDGTNFTSLGSTTSASSDWTQYSYDISSYIGQSVYLALHCVSTWGYYLMADDFLVTASLNASPLDAEFYASFTSGSVPITVDFTDLSTGSPTSWSWTFGDGGTSTLQNPTHTYENPGLYTVSLIVSDGSDSETETKTDYIDIAVPAANTLLTESFETYLPSDWTVIDNDGDGNQWGRFSDDGHDGSISMGVQWNNAGSDDWLITPQLTLTANCSISYSFWARSLSSSSLEDFNVKLSSVGNSVSDFTTTLEAVTSTPDSWTEYVYDLSEYAGQAIFLAVQRVSVGQYYLFVDDFELTADPLLIAGFTADDTTGVLPLTINFTDQSWGNPTSWSWNFGDSGTSADQNPAHTFQTAGSYSISLTVSNGTENDTLIKTDYISVAVQTTFQPQTTAELQTAVDLWVSDSASAVAAYGDINTWDVSLITDMSNLFNGKNTFNDDISNWDVSSVTNMYRIFMNASNFSGDLSNWDVSSVTDMSWVFYGTPFNGDLSSWDVSNVTTMSHIFFSSPFNNNSLANWDVSSVTIMRYMFYGASSFNGDISGWDVSNVTNMRVMFSQSDINQDLSNWDVSSVTDMWGMFERARDFNQDISSWDISSVTVMTSMFSSSSGLSDTNKCFIHWAFQSNDAWPYDWSDLCELEGYTYVPDDNFEQALIDLGYDDVLDNYIVTDSINSVTTINVNSDSISDLTGIEDFTSLTTLNCVGNQLTSLDMSGNTALTYLNCYANDLDSLDVSNNPLLDFLWCQNNQLTSLDVSNNIALTELMCHSNNLDSLDLATNTVLEKLRCNGNQFTTLDLSNNTALDWIWCQNNQLTSLDFSNNVAIETIDCRNN